MSSMKRIPISAARLIAETYGYDQVMIYARKIDRPAGVGETASQMRRGGEHMTTYGVDKTHCAAMARIAEYLKKKILEWES
jgi:hypothetical protein